MNFKYNFLILALIIAVLSSCESDLDSGLNNPNDVSPEALNKNTLMNKIFVGFSDFFRGGNSHTMDLCRMTALTGGNMYSNAISPQSLDDTWEFAYQDVLAQIKALESSENISAFPAHQGVAQVLKAYTYLILVDIFGDVPYSNALDGASGVFNPTVDSGSEIYTAMINELNSAIENLEKTSSNSIERDIYFDGNTDKWVTLANTLLLRTYLNMGDKAGFESIIAKNNIIDSDLESFVYRYSDQLVPAKSRHPLYRNMYQNRAREADGYINNYFLKIAFNGKGLEDPRWRYYFSRQVGSIGRALLDNSDAVPCSNAPKPSHYANQTPFCAFDPGFYGRDHGNNDGVPPDGGAITVVGPYPGGGRLDLNSIEVFAKDSSNFQFHSLLGQGAGGAGLEPIWPYFLTDFILAEAVLTLGISGDALEHLKNGIENSITYVHNFSAPSTEQLEILNPLVTSTDEYIARVENIYNSSSDKLDVYAVEFLIAAFGNGIEGYNMYRRTAKPLAIQPMRNPTPGVFIRSLPYSANFVNLNSGVSQKEFTASNKVFWDTNPDNLYR